MRIKLWDPLQELAEFERTVDRLLGRGRHRMSYGYPPIDLMDTGAAFVLSARLPGVSTDQIRLSVSGTTVTLEGQREPMVMEGATPILRERLYGQFRKSIDLPEPVHEEEVKAQYTDGILQVTLPKGRQLQPKTIPIQ